MKTITVTVPHDLDRAGAKARIENGFSGMRQQFAAMGVQDVTQQWKGDMLLFRAKGMGQTLDGRIDVRDKDVQIELDLPMLLVGMAERIRGGIEKQGQAMLEHKPKGA
jgi:putative polyhydroxyalkanoate system protein